MFMIVRYLFLTDQERTVSQIKDSDPKKSKPAESLASSSSGQHRLNLKIAAGNTVDPGAMDRARAQVAASSPPGPPDLEPKIEEVEEAAQKFTNSVDSIVNALLLVMDKIDNLYTRTDLIIQKAAQNATRMTYSILINVISLFALTIACILLFKTINRLENLEHRQIVAVMEMTKLRETARKTDEKIDSTKKDVESTKREVEQKPRVEIIRDEKNPEKARLIIRPSNPVVDLKRSLLKTDLPKLSPDAAGAIELPLSLDKASSSRQ